MNSAFTSLRERRHVALGVFAGLTSPRPSAAAAAADSDPQGDMSSE